MAFIRALRARHDCLAVDLMYRSLDEGSTPDQVFFTGEKFGFWLAANFETPQRVRVAFGCQAGPLAGDGGEWTVTFAEDGSVLTVAGGDLWIS